MTYTADIDLEAFTANLIAIDILYSINLILLLYINFVNMRLVSFVLVSNGIIVFLLLILPVVFILS